MTAGLEGRIERTGSPARYESRIRDHHPRLVCRKCGTVTDVDCVAGHATCLEPSAAAGFEIDAAEVTFWGLCPACQPAAENSGSPPGAAGATHHSHQPQE